jgi:hypothetical protein
MKLLVLAWAALVGVATGRQQSLRGSDNQQPLLKRVPLAVENEQLETTLDDEQITAKLEAEHGQSHVVPSLAWTPIVPMQDEYKQ